MERSQTVQRAHDDARSSLHQTPTDRQVSAHARQVYGGHAPSGGQVDVTMLVGQ